MRLTFHIDAAQWPNFTPHELIGPDEAVITFAAAAPKIIIPVAAQWARAGKADFDKPNLGIVSAGSGLGRVQVLRAARDLGLKRATVFLYAFRPARAD